MEVIVTAIEIRNISRIIRMVLEDVISINGLTISGYGVHSVDNRTVSYRSKRITCEVQVRHRINEKMRCRCNAIYQEIGMNLAKLFKGNSGHGFQNQFLLIGKLL